ncbi:TetR/AcrR family transcriptional regulator [Bacillus sp. ISL-51]|uniref:TetR/AcrR family transcriptional regulator n=1 Tax=Bacteria TaxID=2 RepID=UPI001BE592D0|nr:MULTISPECIES: TetR/AcrR family transcriptional regulator [Bacteria]MBT2574760.1 TetR/AcrR family transcriptional regulator [Bacillus sp. ISL-51]MBT2635639.1 TetR/AcrR family transcriptional regulator [Bacillus sp. ISL-26]MBT2714285.1 TetR/AcrR family transcriptional regulator [Pseudomonas sp. ISL-88]
MKEKEKLIIETAIKLFARKGYKSTSVQEIADECKISKGAFYIYFPSKEALLLSMLNYYYDKTFTRITTIQTEGDSPRAAYQKQLAVFYESILAHQDFIAVQMKDGSLPYTEEVAQCGKRIRRSILQFHIDSLLNIYGEKVEPYTAELCFLIEGINQIYLEYILLTGRTVQPAALADTVIHRVDDIVNGMADRRDEPFISLDEASSLFGPLHNGQPDPLSKSILQTLRASISTMDKSQASEFTESLEILEAEMKKKSPKLAIIKGMILNLKESELLAENAEQLSYLLKQQFI